jgi:hypothetical protein
LLDRFNFLLDHAHSSSSATSLASGTSQLAALTQLRVSHLLPVIELVISSQLPIPDTLRNAKDHNRQLMLAKLLLGFIADDLLPSIHHSNMDAVLEGGAIGFALDRVDPRKLANGDMDAEEATSVADAVWRVAESKGWREHYETGNASAMASFRRLESRTEASNRVEPVGPVHTDDTTRSTMQYHDSNLLSSEHVLSPSMTSIALGSVTLPAHSISERTVTDDATITGSYRGIGEGGYLGFVSSSPEESWRAGEPANEVHGIVPRRLSATDGDDDDNHHYRITSDDEGFGIGAGSSSSEVRHDTTIDIITSSFSHSSSSIPIRYDGMLHIVDLEDELRSFELDREVRQGTSWSDHAQEVRVVVQRLPLIIC